MTKEQQWGVKPPAPTKVQQTPARPPQTASAGAAAPTRDTPGSAQPSPSGLPASPMERLARYYEQPWRERTQATAAAAAAAGAAAPQEPSSPVEQIARYYEAQQAAGGTGGEHGS